MNKFRPQEISKLDVMRRRLKTGRSENYNWQNRVEWYPVSWGPNKRTIGRLFSRLHYLACHAPQPVQHRWRSAYRTFMNRHFGAAGQASMRYLNKRSCHSWL